MSEEVERDPSKSGRDPLRTKSEGWLHRGCSDRSVMLAESLDMNKDRDVVMAQLCAHLSPIANVHLIIIPHVYDPVGRNVIQEHPERPCDIMRAIQVLVGPSGLHL